MGERSTSHATGGRFVACRGGMSKQTLQLLFCLSAFFDENPKSTEFFVFSKQKLVFTFQHEFKLNEQTCVNKFKFSGAKILKK